MLNKLKDCAYSDAGKESWNWVQQINQNCNNGSVEVCQALLNCIFCGHFYQNLINKISNSNKSVCTGRSKWRPTYYKVLKRNKLRN